MTKRPHPLAKVLDRDAVLQRADERTFARGEEYFRAGQVQEVVETPEGIAGSVLGNRLYAVRIWLVGRRIRHSCNCPVGEDGEFCKHCVALGLAWIERPPSKGRRSPPRTGPAVTMDDVRAELSKREKADLVEIVMQRAAKDEALRDRLLMDAARRRPKEVEIATFKKAIDRAVRTRRFVAYHEMYGYVRRIEDAVDSVRSLLEEGHAPEVIEITEHAFGAVEGAMESVDDSDGGMGGVLRHLEELHLRACKEAKPEPLKLAQRLFAIEMTSAFDVLHGAAETYRDVLGPEGLAEYTALACTVWSKVPALGPGDHDKKWSADRFRITCIMETLAAITEDVDAMLAVKERDLSTTRDFLGIAQILLQADRTKDALAWAERGVRVFEKSPDPELRTFLADLYHGAKRHADAMALVWSNFSEHPVHEGYVELKQHAEQAKQWTHWRARAMKLLRDRASVATDARPRGRWELRGSPDRSILVRILLWENDVDAAWEEAKAGGCGNDLWMELAKRREKQHPEDALFIVEGQIEPTLSGKDKYAYEQAVRLLRKARALMVRLGREEKFGGLLAAVRAAHRPKRNFIKLLDQETWA